MKLFDYFKNKYSTAKMQVDLAKSIRRAAVIQRLPLTEMECFNLAPHILADIKSGEI